MLPSLRSFISALDDSSCPHVSWYYLFLWLCRELLYVVLVFPYFGLVLLLEYSEGGGMEDAHDAKTCSQSFGSLPYCRGDEELCCEQSDVERIMEGGEEGGSSS